MSDGSLVRLIRPEDPVADFSSGVHALDDFLKRHALKNSVESNSLGKTWLLHRDSADPPEFPPILGFFTLSMSSVESGLVSPVVQKKLPRYPAPVALLGRLAVDLRAQKRRLGAVLIREAFRQVQLAATHLGCAGVLVEAKNADLIRLYEHAGFVLLGPERWPRPLFCPMSTIEKLLRRPPHAAGDS